MSWGRVIGHSCLILFLAIAVGFIFNTLSLSVTIGIVMGITIGFTYAAYSVRCQDWQHLIAVAVGFWLLDIVIVLYFSIPLLQWILSIFFAFVYAAIGWAIARVILRLRRSN